MNVRTAILTSVSHLPSMGYLPLEPAIYPTSEDSDGDSDENTDDVDDELAVTKALIMKIKSSLAEVNVPLWKNLAGSPMSKHLIATPLGTSEIAGLNHRLVELYNLGRDSPDLVVGGSAQRSRELTEFRVTPELITELEQFWSKSFVPTIVKVLPYQINIYPPGAEYPAQRDSPVPGVLGTILVGLGSNTPLSRHLLVNGSSWVPNNGDLCAFYSDVWNEVHTSDGFRATIAFKVYAVDPSSPGLSRNESAKIQELLRALPRPCGFLLSHDYSQDPSNLRCSDAVLVANLPAGYQFMPMAVSIDKEYEYDEQSSVGTKVTPLTSQVIAHFSKASRPIDFTPGIIEALYGNLPRDPIPFYTITEGYLWDRQEQDPVHEGDYRRGVPGFLNTVSVNMAVLLPPN